MTVQLSRSGRVVLHHLLQEHPDIAAKRLLAGQHFEEERAQRVDVAPTVRVMTGSLGLLRRHVGGRSDDLAVERHRYLARLAFRQTEIHQMRFPRRVDHDVTRLQIAMDDACFVRVVQRLGDLHTQEGRFVRAQTRFREHFIKRLSLDEIANNIRSLVVRSHFSHVDDVRMPKLGRRTRLLQESFRVFAANTCQTGNFDRDDAIQTGVSCLPYRPEGPRARPTEQFIMPDSSRRARLRTRRAVGQCAGGRLIG